MLIKSRQSSDTTGRLLYNTARATLCWERLWPTLVPLFLVMCAFLAFSWIGAWHSLEAAFSIELIWAIRAIFAAAFGMALWPLRKFSVPGDADVIRRIEVKSRLENRPLTAQADTMAMGRTDMFANALWRVHQSRMSDRLDHMTSGAPKPHGDRFDPVALRAMLPILAFAAFFYSFAPGGGRIADAFQGHVNPDELLTRMDAWISPPSYTRKPPVYLSTEEQQTADAAIGVPAGSEFFLRFVGRGDLQVLQIDSSGEQQIEQNDPDGNADEAEFTFKLQGSSVVRLKHRGEELASWSVETSPDLPPKISFAEDPRSALSGSLELSYSVEDDYGVTLAEGRVKSLEAVDPNARPLVEPPKLALPLPRHRAKSGTSQVNRDLTEHPWAGSKVSITLYAHDDAKQSGASEAWEMILPGRRFSKPLAQALIEQRRLLALDARNQHYVANLLDAVSMAPEDFIEDLSVFMGMKIAYRRIVSARNDDDLKSSLDLLWEVALAIEFGDLSDTERRLREAQEALSKALEEGASEEEVNKLMQELRQAMNEMMQALADEARRNPQSQNPFNPHDQSQFLSQKDLERMMDRIEDLAKSGSEDAARELLSELQRMMDNLRAGQHQQQRQAEGNQMNQALDELSELMQRQQDLMNETFRMQRQKERGLNKRGEDQNNQPGGNRRSQQQDTDSQRQGNGVEGEETGPSPMTPEEFAEALKRLQEQQEALRQQLSELSQQLEDLGLDPTSEFGEAGEQMGEAGEKLGQGESGGAAENQGQAIEALRQGAQSMMQQMAGDRQQGGQQQGRRGSQGMDDFQRSGVDPLGRKTGNQGMDAESGINIPGEIDAQRARRILEAIRKRLSIPDNPVIERDYLERLLNSR